MKTLLRRCCLFYLLISAVPQTFAYWSVVEETNDETGDLTQIARINNAQGYRLDIYKDSDNIIKLRFSGSTKHGLMASEHCPSFQVDDYQVFNRSINNENCERNGLWSEFILGALDDDKVFSTALYRIQNGNQLVFRFILDVGGYQQTAFTLAGSSRVILSVLGIETNIRKTRP